MSPGRSLPVSAAAALACLGAALAGAAPAAAAAEERLPIIYSTDLYHPHDDPDDHYDLLTLLAHPRFDVRAIVLDQGPRGAGRLGVMPLRQAMAITGRSAPYAPGLVENLGSGEDTGAGQPAPAQAGVELILRSLAEPSSGAVTVFTTGSLRDVAAAYNRDPALVAARVARLYVNAGHSAGGREWNVDLDPHAYCRIMQSQLPVYWVPCFGVPEHQSLWRFRQGELLDAAPAPVQNYILFALTRAPAGESDPAGTLRTFAVEPGVRARLWAEERNMWCTAAFLHAAGVPGRTFGFTEGSIEIDPDGVTRMGTAAGAVRHQVFTCTRPESYPAEMFEALQGIVGAIASRP